MEGEVLSGIEVIPVCFDWFKVFKSLNSTPPPTQVHP